MPSSVRRTKTVKAPKGLGTGAARVKVTVDTVQQGFKELYNPTRENKSVVPNVDIVFVPGLGTDPELSWRSESGFNWAAGTKKDGLARDFPNARILLYQYESAWWGDLKVKQFLHDIARSLLVGLDDRRYGIRDRPIVFIGHSMGGLVVAKAITLAATSRRDLAPGMFECIAGCAFFGTPFGGTSTASAAAMVGQLGEMVGLGALRSNLIEMMQPEDERLHELTHEFMRLTTKLSPRFELIFFSETHKTKLPVLSHYVRSAETFYVTRESATLPGYDSIPLRANHSTLVKFDDIKDDRYQLVLAELKKLINGAGLVVKSRLNSTRGIDQETVNDVQEMLNGAQVVKRRRALAQNFQPSTWVSDDPEYCEWLKISDNAENVPRHGDALLIRGPEGRGKTRATMAALQDIDTLIHADEEFRDGRGAILYAYFFCDTSSDFATAEDLLKSFVRQLINQQPILATYAKRFVQKKGTDDSSRSYTNLTVENLWQTLQDILTDEFMGRRVYFVINNLHMLPEDAESTSKLMEFLHEELLDLRKGNERRVSTRWLITSRDVHYVETLNLEGVRLVDLEDDKYCDRVQLELRRTAQEKVAELSRSKKYNKALAFFASSLIGRRASNSQWINLACLQLQELPEAESDQTIRRMLESLPQDLNALLDSGWKQIFHAHEEDVEKLKEVLRTLLLVFEDPTDKELGVLTGLASSEEERAELRALIGRCRPLLTIKQTSKTEYTISFMNAVVRDHLLDYEKSKNLLPMTDEEKKWQHGMIALRCLAYIKESLDFVSQASAYEATLNKAEDSASGLGGAASGAEGTVSKPEDEGAHNNDGAHVDWSDDDSSYCGEEVLDDMEAAELKDKALRYPVKNWLHHASRATRDMADDLSEDEFWAKDSLIRYRWLVEYMRLNNVLHGFEAKRLSALHVAASVGFRQLVIAMIQSGHRDEINQRNDQMKTPLHLAASLGRANIVEELLKQGARIDDGLDVGAPTPLHEAARRGHIKVMKLLIDKHANANAVAMEVGPVMNAAIISGNPDAVKLLVEKEVSLAVDDDYMDSPLALAGLFSNSSMFEYLTSKYAAKLPPKEFDKALVKAAEAGRVDVFNRLLKYPHPQSCYQEALKEAAKEGSWDIIKILLERCQGLDCNDLLLSAATTMENQDKILEAIWAYTKGGIAPETLNDSLYQATDREKKSTVRILAEKFRASPNARGPDYGNALTAAAYDGTLEIVELLVTNGADVDSRYGWALQIAAGEGHYSVVQKLLDYGANVNAVSAHKRFPQGTALQAAVESGKVEMVKLLLAHRADPDLGAGEFTCPIIAAASKGEKVMLELLVHAGANVTVFGGWDNSTVLSNAAARLPVESLKLLLEAGADVNLADEDGDTPLIGAALRGDRKCVKFLLEHGADMFHCNDRGDNAMQTALLSGRQSCLALLVNRVSSYVAELKNKTAVMEREMAALNQSQGGALRQSYDAGSRPAVQDVDEDVGFRKSQRLSMAKEPPRKPSRTESEDTYSVSGSQDTSGTLQTTAKAPEKNLKQSSYESIPALPPRPPISQVIAPEPEQEQEPFPDLPVVMSANFSGPSNPVSQIDQWAEPLWQPSPETPEPEAAFVAELAAEREPAELPSGLGLVNMETSQQQQQPQPQPDTVQLPSVAQRNKIWAAAESSEALASPPAAGLIRRKPAPSKAVRNHRASMVSPAPSNMSAVSGQSSHSDPNAPGPGRSLSTTHTWPYLPHGSQSQSSQSAAQHQPQLQQHSSSTPPLVSSTASVPVQRFPPWETPPTNGTAGQQYGGDYFRRPSEDDSRASLKSKKSMFGMEFGAIKDMGGMKNTFDKAKQLGTDLTRKYT